MSMLNFRSWASSVSVAVLTIGLVFAQQTNQKAVAQIINIQGACSGAAGTVLNNIQIAGIDAGDYCQAVGREEAIRRFQAQQVDFAAIDSPPLDPVPVIPRRGTAIQVPIAGLSIAMPFNVPGVGSLNLSRQTYCGILSGAITNWNAPEIAGDNPEVTLPDLPITVVYNSNSSTSTFLFTNHLNTACASTAYPWSAGVGMSASFPVGVGVQDTAVVNTVASTAGALGYADNAIAIQAGLPVATLQNKAGNFIAPTPSATSVAFTGTSASLVPDPAQANAYPIVGLTFVLFYGRYQSFIKSITIPQAFTTALTNGDDIIRSLGYAPLPQDRKNAAISAVNSI